MVAFHQESQFFPPPTPRFGGGGVDPSPPAGAGAALVDSELTKNATAAPKPDTPTALGGGNKISNITLPTGLEVQEFTSKAKSDITSVASSGTNGNNSTYLESQKNLPKNKDKTLDLSTIIKEVVNIHKVVITDITNLN